MVTRTVALVTGADDWEALYLDGELVDQGDTITAREALQLAQGLGAFRLELVLAGPLGDFGEYPAFLADVVRKEATR